MPVNGSKILNGMENRMSRIETDPKPIKYSEPEIEPILPDEGDGGDRLGLEKPVRIKVKLGNGKNMRYFIR